MKKILSCGLVIIVILSMLSISAGAMKTSKMDQLLSEAIAAAEDDELISVWIWFTDIDQDELEGRIEAESGLSRDEISNMAKDTNLNRTEILAIMDALQNPDLTQEERQDLLERKEAYFEQLYAENAAFEKWYFSYIDIRNKVSEEMYTENNSRILDMLKIPKNNIIFFDTAAPSAIVKADKNTILTIEQTTNVTAIYLYQDKDVVEPVSKTVKEKLSDYLNQLTNGYDSSILHYEELYTHRDETGDIDWVLLYSQGGAIEPWIACSIVNHRVIIGGTFGLFRCGMGLYDAKKDTFYDLAKIQDYSAYNGLSTAIDTYGKGRLLGDVDGDDKLSIVDVTMIQRVLAGLDTFPESDIMDYYSNTRDFIVAPHYYSDFNRDGKRNIVDATEIQRSLAGL